MARQTKTVEATVKTYDINSGRKSLPISAILRTSGMESMSINNALHQGQLLRDQVFVKYPLLPEAVFIFQQIVSGREWAIGGKPDDVFTALDFVANARSKNLVTGSIDYGFEGFLKRRALDYTLVGRTAFAIHTEDGEDRLIYMDPTKLFFDRQGDTKAKNGSVLPARPKERLWVYDYRRYKTEDVVIHHPLPIGSDLFVAPVSWLIPAANLAYLIAEHNAGSLDGRKIKDLLLVGSPTLRDSIESALIKLAQLYNGADVSEVGIPIVEINNMTGTPIRDLFAMLGLSNMPESLDQEKFMFNYSNQIAGTVGVALRHFWNDERNTNRALEEVQEARQQYKGPESFIRSEQRLINSSGFLNRVTNGKVRFGFLEESDLVSLQTKADVLKAYGDAALSFRQVFGASLTLQSFMSWMKRIGALPLDIELDESAAEESPDGDDTDITEATETAAESDEALLKEGEVGASSDAEVVNMEKSLEYGSVVVNGDGQIIGRRARIFSMPSIASYVSEKVLAEERLRQKRLEQALKDAEEYTEGKSHDEVDRVVDHQINLMVGYQLNQLLGSSAISAETRDKLRVIAHKHSFNLALEQSEVDFVEEMCDKHDISMFDSTEELKVQ